MATKAAHKRLTREYQAIQKSPPEYITAHPSESNILEWQYILTGPPDTPYAGGQYWGTLTFPSNYPFAPPAIRMHTPSGRFKCSERLCLSISDFHPKSFNPAWEVSTILLGVLSFMTSEEITTGSIKASESERKVYAYRTRWWNSTGGGSTDRTLNGLPAHKRAGFGAIKAGDGGKRFREEWPEEDAENWKWMQENEIDPQTGAKYVAGGHDANGTAQSAAGTSVESPTASAVEKAASEAKNAQSWFARNKMYVIGGVLFVYVAAARLLRDHQEYS